MIDHNDNPHCDWCGDSLASKKERCCRKPECVDELLEDARKRRDEVSEVYHAAAKEVHVLEGVRFHRKRVAARVGA